MFSCSVHSKSTLASWNLFHTHFFQSVPWSTWDQSKMTGQGSPFTLFLEREPLWERICRAAHEVTAWDTCSSLETWTEWRISPLSRIPEYYYSFPWTGIFTYEYIRSKKARWLVLKSILGLYKQYIHAKTSYWIYLFFCFILQLQ